MNRRIHFRLYPKAKSFEFIERIDTFKRAEDDFHKVGLTIKDQRTIYVSDPEKAIKFFKGKSDQEVKEVLFNKLNEETRAQIRSLLEIRADEEICFEFSHYKNENKRRVGVEFKFYDKNQTDRTDQKVHELIINLHINVKANRPGSEKASNSILGIIRSPDFKFTDMVKAKAVKDLKLDEKSTFVLYKVKVLQSEE